MVHDKYELLDFSNEVGGASFVVWFYGNTQVIDNNFIHSDSNIVSAVADACKQLMDFTAIDSWSIYRWKGEEDDKNFPCMDLGDSLNSNHHADRFHEFLDDREKRHDGYGNDCYDEDPLKNGTGENLLKYRGAHFFIHNSGDCTKEWASGSSYSHINQATESDVCSSNHAQTALERGRMVWMKAACNDPDKAKNTAIQEPLHQVIMWKHEDIWDDLLAETGEQKGDLSNEDEHRLGLGDKYTNEVTPMMTYHYEELEGKGFCSEDGGAGGHYTTELTSCTKEAVRAMSSDEDCYKDV